MRTDWTIRVFVFVQQLIAHLEAAVSFFHYNTCSRTDRTNRKKNEPTEAAVLRVLWEIFAAVDRGDHSALVILDLFAASGTFNHDTLITRLGVTKDLIYASQDAKLLVAAV